MNRKPPSWPKFQENFRLLKKVAQDLFQKKALIIVHQKPDVDALGSAFSLSWFLSNNGVENQIFSPTSINENYSRLFSLNKINFSPEVISKESLKIFSAIFILDRSATFFDLKLQEKINFQTQTVINIDHHQKSFIPGAINIVNSKAAATCEIIFDFFKSQNLPLSSEISQHLLGGIYSDTGGFIHDNTSAENLSVAAELMKNGASITKIKKVFFANKKIGALKLWGIALERARLNKGNGMLASFVTQKDLQNCQASIHDIDGLSEILNTSPEAKFSLILSERENGTVKASLRSEKHKEIDVSAIARTFNGGGHKLSSGFELEGKLMEKEGEWMVV